MNSQISMERLKQRVSYDPETGVFIWRETLGGKCREGWPAGRLGTGKAAGYMRITIDGCEYKAHRLAWFYMTGEWPKDQIDHINGNPSDNRWSNLREATQSQNKANTRAYRNSKSGIVGVCWSASNRKWNASINKDGKRIHLGRYHDLATAISVRQAKAKELFGELAPT